MQEQHWSHDIRDPAAFVARIVTRNGGDLDHHQRERLHQFLLIALWELSLTYDRGDPRFPSNFSGHAGSILPRRVVDWRRSPEEGGRTRWQFAGHTYERPRIRVDSLDRLEPAHTQVGVEDPLPSDPALQRILGEGSSSGARQNSGVARDGARRAA